EIPPADASRRHEGDASLREPDSRALLALDGSDEVHRVFAARLAADHHELLAVAQLWFVRRQRDNDLSELLAVGGEVDEVDRLLVGRGFAIIVRRKYLADRARRHGCVVGGDVPGDSWGGDQRECTQ